MRNGGTRGVHTSSEIKAMGTAIDRAGRAQIMGNVRRRFHLTIRTAPEHDARARGDRQLSPTT
jgi:hypothetical protein